MKNLSIDEQLFIFLLLCTTPSALIWIFNSYYVQLTENSLLYLHATSAQVISALIALSLVAYTFLNSELNQEIRDGSSSEDAISLTKHKAFKDLTITLSVGLFSIISSLIVLSSFKYQSTQDLFISISFFSLLIFIYTLLNFILRSFLPGAIEKNNDEILEESKSELNELINEKSAKTQSIETEGFDSSNFGENYFDSSIEKNLGKFFIAFSAFENKLRNIYTQYNFNVPANRNGSLQNIINNLVNLKIIPSYLHKEFIYLIRIRNSLAHSSHNTDMSSDEILKYINLIKSFEKILNLETYFSQENDNE